MTVIKWAALLLGAALLFTGCDAAAPIPASSAVGESSLAVRDDEPADSAVTQRLAELYDEIAQLTATMDDTPIPRQERVLIHDEAISDLPPQLILDEPTAYLLAQQILNVSYFGDNILPDFDSDEPYVRAEVSAAMTKTVLWRTASQVHFYGDSKDPETGLYALDGGEYPNHRLLAMVLQERANGDSVGEIYNPQDVQATALRLFGSTDVLSQWDIHPYEYHPQEEVYTQKAVGFGGSAWPYAQITAYEETERGYVCEAVIINALHADSLYEENGVTLTAENFEEATAGRTKRRYTFIRNAEGQYLLTALETIRAAQ